MQPDRRLDPRLQMRGQRLARKLFAQHVAQRLDACALGGECGIARDLPFERKRVGRIEFTVDMRVDEQHGLVRVGRLVRGPGHGSFVPIISIKRRRARASRDITVPTGTSVTRAISR